MADESQTIRAINWREVFPFLHIFRAFRVAVHPSKLVLGLLALLTLYAGGRILDALWRDNSRAIYGEAAAFERNSRRDTPGDFAQLIEGRRESNRAGYARLIESIETRDRAIEAAAKSRDAALEENKKVTDAKAKADRDRAAHDAFNAAEVTAIRAFDEAPTGAAASKEATEAAKTFARTGEVRRRIMHGRDRALENAARRRDAALANAPTIADATQRADAERKAREQYTEDERAAFAQAHEHLETAQQLLSRGIFSEFLDYEVRQVNNVVTGVTSNNWTGGLDPRAARGGDAAAAAAALVPGARPAGPAAAPAPDGVIHSVINFLTVGPSWLFSHHWLYAILFTILFLLVWAVFGGAIARIAAVHVARDEKISVRQALRFSISKLLSFVFAPVIPLLIVLGIGLVLALGGLLFYVPIAGPIVAGALFILALLGGVVITLVLFGTVGGFNLMYPTIAVEGSDSFDAISRSFSYVFARPWRMIFYTAVAVLYGALTYLFVKFFIYVVMAVTHFFVGWFLGGQPGRWYPEMFPDPSLASLPYDVAFSGLAWSEWIAAALITFWNYLLIGLLGAFAISFYFSVNTIIYYLMRREVDATELEDVYVEETDEDLADTGPITPTPVGTPAAVAATSAPGGGLTGTAGSGPVGGSPDGGAQAYPSPDALPPKDNPPQG